MKFQWLYLILFLLLVQLSFSAINQAESINDSLNGVLKRDSIRESFFQKYYAGKHFSAEYKWQQTSFYNVSYGASWIIDGDDLPVNTVCLKGGSDIGWYNKNLFIAPRISAEYYWLFANGRVSFSYLSDLKQGDFRVSPEVGLGISNFFFFNLGYDFVIGRNNFKDLSGPKFTVGINFLLVL